MRLYSGEDYKEKTLGVPVGEDYRKETDFLWVKVLEGEKALSVPLCEVYRREGSEGVCRFWKERKKA